MLLETFNVLQKGMISSTLIDPEHKGFDDFRAAVKTATGVLGNGNVLLMRNVTLGWDGEGDTWAEVPHHRTVTLSSNEGILRLSFHFTGTLGIFLL